MRQVRAAGLQITAVLGDAEFGDNTRLRTALHRARLPYALGISSELTVFRGTPTLTWSAGPQGTLYTVEVARADLTVIARADEIATAHFQVPDSALSGLPPGATVLWRVEAVLPDATRVSSPVFRARIR